MIEAARYMKEESKLTQTVTTITFYLAFHAGMNSKLRHSCSYSCLNLQFQLERKNTHFRSQREWPGLAGSNRKRQFKGSAVYRRRSRKRFL